MGFQELDIVRVVESLTKYAVTITVPESIRYHMEKAIHLARSGRPGPVWLDIPLDVQSTVIDESKLGGYNRRKAWKPSTTAGKPGACRNRTAQRVQEALDYGRQRRPGSPAHSMKIEVNFSRSCDIPPHYLETGRHYLRRSSSFRRQARLPRRRAANFARQESDFMLFVGARASTSDRRAITTCNFPEGGEKDHDQQSTPRKSERWDVDMDVPIPPTQAGRLSNSSEQSDSVATRGTPTDWRERYREWKSRYPVILPEYWNEREGVSTYV